MKRTVTCRAIIVEFCEIGKRAVIRVCGADNPEDNVRMITDSVVTNREFNKTEANFKAAVIDGFIETETEIFKTGPRKAKPSEA